MIKTNDLKFGDVVHDQLDDEVVMVIGKTMVDDKPHFDIFVLNEGAGEGARMELTLEDFTGSVSNWERVE